MFTNKPLKQVVVFSLAIIFIASFVGAKVHAEKLIVIGHKVHQQVATGVGEGENIVDDFVENHEEVTGIEWRTYGIDDIHQRLFREGGLEETTVDVGYLVNFRSTPKVADLFEPLGNLREKEPVNDFEDFAPGMVKAMTFDGKLYGIPVRGVPNVLHINTAYFEEQDVEIPETLEELYEAAKKLTFTKENGQKVYGIAPQATKDTIADQILVFARGWPDVNYVNSDYEVTVDSEPIVKTVRKYKELYDEGVLPPGSLSMDINDKISYFQSGRAAMIIGPPGYNKTFNDPEESRIAGDAKVITLPASEEAPEMDISSGLLNFWSMAIPKGATDKELSWDFIRHISSKESQLQMAFNGNSPTRMSIYDTSEYEEVTPYADATKQMLSVARVPWPAFPGVAEASNVLGNEVHKAILGEKTADAAMKDAAKRIEEIIPEDLQN